MGSGTKERPYGLGQLVVPRLSRVLAPVLKAGELAAARFMHRFDKPDAQSADAFNLYGG